MSEPRIFTYQEALESFPSVQERTAEAVREVKLLYAGGSADIGDSPEADPSGPQVLGRRKQELENAIAVVIEKWAQSIIALGCEVKGPWLVDWDSGDGYYCWRYPEPALAHYHSYDEGFGGRVPIQ